MRGFGSGVNLIMLGVVIVFGFTMVGTQWPLMPGGVSENQKNSATIVDVDMSHIASAEEEDGTQNTLQLKTFSGVIRPTAGPPEKTCNANNPVDVMVTLDYSGSMSGEKLKKAKEAAKSLVSVLETNPANKMGINSFNDSAKLYTPLTNQHTILKAIIDNLPSGSGRTCLKCGIDMANAEIAANSSAASVGTNSAAKRVDILLTDGNANRPLPEFGAGQLALDAARQGYSQSGISYYTIGFGAESGTPLGGGRSAAQARVNETLLKQISTETKGKYYYSPSDDDLKYIFEDIGLIICN